MTVASLAKVDWMERFGLVSRGFFFVRSPVYLSPPPHPLVIVIIVTGRRMAVLDPVKVVIVNVDDNFSVDVECANKPGDDSLGVYVVPLTKTFYIQSKVRSCVCVVLCVCCACVCVVLCVCCVCVCVRVCVCVGRVCRVCIWGALDVTVARKSRWGKLRSDPIPSLPQDFRNIGPDDEGYRDFFGLTPGRSIRLKYGGIATFADCVADADGNITESTS